MSTLFLELTEGQLDILADAIFKRMAKQPVADKPLSVDEMATALGVSKDTIYRRIQAGEIRTIPGMGRKLIPAIELARLLDPDQGGNGK